MSRPGQPGSRQPYRRRFRRRRCYRVETQLERKRATSRIVLNTYKGKLIDTCVVEGK